eukprot:2909299-Pleurochrysis_carterae.AAC.1
MLQHFSPNAHLPRPQKDPSPPSPPPPPIQVLPTPQTPIERPLSGCEDPKSGPNSSSGSWSCRNWGCSSIGRHMSGGGRRLPRRCLRLDAEPDVAAAEPVDSPCGAVSEPAREQSSGPTAPGRGAERATDSARLAKGDER